MTDKFVTFNENRPRTGLPEVVDTRIDERYATKSELDEVVAGAGGVTSPSVSRIIASSDPNTPLNEGDLLLLYSPARSIFQSFSTMDGLTPRWAGGTWDIAADESADGGSALQLTGASARRLISLDDADGLRDVEIVARIKVGRPGSAVLGGGLAVRGSGEPGAENGYITLTTSTELRIAKFVGGVYTQLGAAPVTVDSSTWYWIRFRVKGTSIAASLWADGQSEPDEWMVSTTDQSVTGGGWVGASSSTNASTQSWDVIGIAEIDTGTEKAPVTA